MKKSLFFLCFFLPLAFAFSKAEMPTTCPEPANVHKVFQSNGTVSFDWDDCGCHPTEYRVYYVKGGYTSPEYPVSTSNIAFSNLSAGSYDFFFYTVCSGGISGVIGIEDLMIN